MERRGRAGRAMAPPASSFSIISTATLWSPVTQQLPVKRGATAELKRPAEWLGARARHLPAPQGRSSFQALGLCALAGRGERSCERGRGFSVVALCPGKARPWRLAWCLPCFPPRARPGPGQNLLLPTERANLTPFPVICCSLKGCFVGIL